MNISEEKLTNLLSLLRNVVQAEIDYAFQVENGYRFSYETREANARKWQELKTLLLEEISDEE